ncbi:MAG: 2-dehydro-3-deoxyphosphogluconate aldolase / (4S)-4-hydroxy-2-oxoglutarate aldolase [Thermosediminibacterales bacterium]|nr:2-dehydro-3-deoxyphosphogluconate aldolase / (4S)-4-hydroxy-2-oxoglutarate aldolase [Thermosediminibacterales bacterium]MDK2836523.1 2-dehydro-3-deoxyphosphogluconate aldolase / (4S)-4-hydroxy-2-oxoglutarate aldolase [Thermosediminibacterales bacterium]
MIPKYENLKRILESGIIAVVRAESPEQALKIAGACKEGGITSIEITMTVPGAIDVIKQVASAYPKDQILVGAGTVLDAETARAAMLAGAEYIVSPHLNQEVVKICNRYQKICMPGAMTIKEIVEAMEAGADVVKLFPGSLFGPKIIKAVKGPLPQAELIPTGGVSLDNVEEWIKAGAAAVGVGGDLTKEAIQKNDYSIITQKARQFVEKIKKAKQNK